MAYTVSIVGNSVFGNKQIKFLKVAADAATGSIDSGLAVLECFSFAPISMTTASGKFFINAGVSGTSIIGFMGISGIASGDSFFLTVFGH